MKEARYWSTLLIAKIRKNCAALISAVSLYLIARAYGIPFSSQYVALALLAMMLTAVFIKDTLPNLSKIRIKSGHFGSIVTGWLIVVVWLLIVGYATKQLGYFSRATLFTWLLVTPFIILFSQWTLEELFVRLMASAHTHRKAVIVGISDVSRTLAKSIATDKRLGMKLEGFFEDRNSDRCGETRHGRLLGNLSEVARFVVDNGVQVIYITLPINHLVSTRVLLDNLQDTTASVYFVPNIFVFDLIQSRVDDIHGLPVLALLETPFYGYNGALKRVFDLVCSTLILMLILPVLFGIATAIKSTSPGPVIFRQRRYGLDGKEIIVYKFRTMTVVENGDVIKQAKANDARFTKVGAWLRKHSLDELPQFVNVIQGRMSIVGPRPHAVAHNEMYRKLIKGYMIRHKVLPGITGWAQVNGCRGETKQVEQMEARVRFDLDYLRHWTIWLDFKIILRTVGLIFNDSAAR